jgi:HTH-type transcriptional regulator/antitoxin HigA
VDPVDAIKAHMEMQGLTRTNLARLFESEPRASEILNRRRRLTVEMIARLANEWKIPADWLVQPYELDRAGGTQGTDSIKRGGAASRAGAA